MVYCAAYLVVVAQVNLMAQDSLGTIPNAEALRIIESLEKNWERTSFRCEITRGKLTQLDDLGSLVRDPTMVRAVVTVEPFDERARVDLTGVFPWLNGVSSHLATNASYGYGEALYRQWSIQQGGVDIPPIGARGVGEIGPEDQSRFAELKSMCGLSMFPPFLQQERLSAGLRKVMERGKRLEVTKQPDGRWQIDTFEFDLDEPFWNEDHRVLIEYDPTCGGVITGAVWSGPDAKESGAWKPWKRLHVELADLGDGTKAPRAATTVNLLDRSARRLVFSDIKRNVPIDPAIYRIDFPHNIHVTDHVHNKMYVVGAGLENDQRAVQAFMERYQLAASEPSRSRGWWIALGALAAGTAIVAGLVLFRRSRSTS